MNDPLAILSEAQRDHCPASPMPDWVDPMLATLTHQPFSTGGWIYEPKLDGVRCLAFHDGEQVALYTRNQKQRNETYPQLAGALAGQETVRFILDGEIVAFQDGVSSFSRLQDHTGKNGIDIFYYAFDCLWIGGHDLRPLPLRDRKRVLLQAIRFEGALHYTPHRNRSGEAFLEEACGKGWEGLIAKQADSAYRSGRSKSWLKFRCDNRQEFVVGGYTDPQGSRIGFGALLLGYYENGALHYAGKVGTGFDEKTLQSLHESMASVSRADSPFSGRVRESGVHWVSPELVAEIAFTEWTDDDKLRHPRFLGLREDKAAEDVGRERAQSP